MAIMTVKNPQQAFQGQYEKMEFPPVPWTEYPKALYNSGQFLGIVNNLREEHELLESRGIDHSTPDPLAAALAERDVLLARLAEYENGRAPQTQPAGEKTDPYAGLTKNEPAPEPGTPKTPAPPPGNPLLQQGRAPGMVQPKPGIAVPKPPGG